MFAFSGTLTHSIEVEDNLCAAIKYRNGSFGTIEVSTSCAPGFHRRVEFSGSEGTVAFEEDKITIWEFAKPQEGDDQILTTQMENRIGSGGRNPMDINDMGHRMQMDDFCNAIIENREPLLGGREGRRFCAAKWSAVPTRQPSNVLAKQAKWGKSSICAVEGKFLTRTKSQ